jgi:hypothetical protein
MATRAIVYNPGVIHFCTGEISELTCRVTSLACSTGRQVVARFGNRCHTGKYLTVMASCAAAGNACMDHSCSSKIGKFARRVTRLARRAGRQVVARFSNRCHSCKHLTIVAGCTTVEDASMTHRGAGEVGELARRVASLACRYSWQMVAWLGHRIYSCKALTIVASRAAVEDAKVVHYARAGTISSSMTQGTSLSRGNVVDRLRSDACCSDESSGREMTGRTIQRSRQVCGWCVRFVLGRDASKAQSIAMAAHAIVDDTNMVHQCPGKVGELARRVASLARTIGRQVIARFGYWRDARKYLSVVARCTAAEDATMAHCRSGEVGELAR